MFWKKKIHFNPFGDAYIYVGEEKRWLLDSEDYKKINESIIELEEKLDLILNHLNLKYFPETEKKEPAKLVEKVKKPDFTICGMPSFIGGAGLVSGSGDTTLTSTPKKKKRKYTKSGKYSKKK